ncbi:MAG: hypothetical protein MH137_04885 [Flavobacteriales bacterium]|nr:hypothetical protein [Flavobacteriales bacterium]
MSTKISPCLSIVIVVRNDNYGGDFTQRFQNSLNSLSGQLIKAQLPVELVLVNYNPLTNEMPFEKMITWPVDHPYLIIRMITVPSEVHEEWLRDGKERMKLPVLEFIAKNVGIRRASASFVLSTNADIVFDDRLFYWLKKHELESGAYYRSDRFDFEKLSEDDLLKGIQVSKIWKIYTRLGLYERKKWKPYWLFRFLAFVYARWGRGYSILLAPFSFLEKYRNIIPYVPKRELFLLKYHFHACGDFTLTAKENWEKLRGYPEDTYSAMHTDSLFLISCLASGLKENILPYPVYHQMHTNTFEHNAPEYYNDKMFKRLVEASRFINGPVDFLITNPENWGMADKEFEEVILPLTT